MNNENFDFELEQLETYRVGIEDNFKKIEAIDAYRNRSRLDKHVAEDFEELSLTIGLPAPKFKIGIEGIDYHDMIEAELQVAQEGFFSAIGEFINKIVRWVVDKFNKFTDWLFGIVTEAEVTKQINIDNRERYLKELFEKIDEVKKLNKTIREDRYEFLLDLHKDESSVTIGDIPKLKEKEVVNIEAFFQLINGDVDNIKYYMEDIVDNMEKYLGCIDKVEDYIYEVDEVLPASDVITSFFLGLVGFAFDINNPTIGSSSIELYLTLVNSDAKACVKANIDIKDDDVPIIGNIREEKFGFDSTAVNVSAIPLSEIHNKIKVNAKKLPKYKVNLPVVKLTDEKSRLALLKYAGEKQVANNESNQKALSRKKIKIETKINKANGDILNLLTKVLKLSIDEVARIGSIVKAHNTNVDTIDKYIITLTKDAIKEIEEILED